MFGLEGGCGLSSQREVVVVGGGLCGAATVIHLLRDHAPDVAVTLVEPRATLGAGLAYGTTDAAHRINVAASRMSLFAEEPEQFDAWVRARGMPERDPEGAMADGRLYPRRALFGEYMHETLTAVVEHASGARFRHVADRAVAAAPEGGGWSVRLAGGDVLRADILVLAVSHSAPDLPPLLAGLRGEPGLVPDPWAPERLASLPRDGDVLVVGTGLTACDVVANLRGNGHRGRILMLSRRGQLPRPRTTLPVSAFGEFDQAPAETALALLRRVRAAMRAARALGRPWEDVIDALRSQARVVWGALPSVERHRLLRHLRPFWDAHRFQSAPPIDRLIGAGLRSGDLTLVAGALVRVERAPDGLFAAEFRRRGDRLGRTERVRVAGIVNCTGPGHRSVVGGNPLLRSLATSAGLHADEWHLGIAVDTGSRVISVGGAWPNLFVAGPLARGTHGELMGLPQVSAQPREVAASVAGLLMSGLGEEGQGSALDPPRDGRPLEP